MKSYLLFLAPGALLGSAVVPTIASAQAFGVDQVVVSYADLDLSTRSGVHRLDQRIRDAVETVCGPSSDFDLKGNNEVRACRAETLALTRVHRDTAIAGYPALAKTDLAARK